MQVNKWLQAAGPRAPRHEGRKMSTQAGSYRELGWLERRVNVGTRWGMQLDRCT